MTITLNSRRRVVACFSNATHFRAETTEGAAYQLIRSLHHCPECGAAFMLSKVVVGTFALDPSVEITDAGRAELAQADGAL